MFGIILSIIVVGLLFAGALIGMRAALDHYAPRRED